MARMSRKELQKKVELLEKMVFSLATMHNTVPSELVMPRSFGQRMPHPKALVAQNPTKTSYGYVGFEELVKFVVDGEPLKFKMEDKELVKEVYPDGSVLDVVKNKKKKLEPKIIPTYPLEGPYEMLKEMYSWSVK